MTTPEERAEAVAEELYDMMLVMTGGRTMAAGIIAAAIRAAVAEERERIAGLADELDATYTTWEKGWGLGGPDSTICTEHSFAARIRELE